jgi:hypothetical protein
MLSVSKGIRVRTRVVIDHEFRSTSACPGGFRGSIEGLRDVRIGARFCEFSRVN